jgi:hypothetical protein
LQGETKISVSLSREPKNLEHILRDVDAKGYLDIELVWRLRQKEGLRNVRGRLVGSFSRMKALTALNTRC